MLVRNSHTTIAIPHEPGNSAVIRRVRREVLRAAAETRQVAAIQKVRDLGGPDLIKQLQSLATGVETPPATVSPADAYDETLLLQGGLVGLVGPLYDDATFDESVIADLDEHTARWIAEQILAYATGAEFQTKNG